MPTSSSCSLGFILFLQQLPLSHFWFLAHVEQQEKLIFFSSLFLFSVGIYLSSPLLSRSSLQKISPFSFFIFCIIAATNRCCKTSSTSLLYCTKTASKALCFSLPKQQPFLFEKPQKTPSSAEK
jgi:hypothetical protein